MIESSFNSPLQNGGAARIQLSILLSLFMLFTGCSYLKPSAAAPRYFILAPASSQPQPKEAAAEQPHPAPSSAQASKTLTVAPIKLADYLTKKSIALRKGATEIEYLESALWAERLDQGFLRVLIADLSKRLPTQKIQPGPSRKAGPALELHLTIQQFDINTTGEGVLAADWRILSSLDGKTISGQFHSSHPGPTLERAPGEAVATLSTLINELSGELAQALK
jgi:uncharacterized lipoprotein YmbA